MPQTHEGCFYIAASLIRNLDKKEALPPRYLGILKINIDKSAQRLQVKISAPQKVEPGQLIAINIHCTKMNLGSPCRKKLMAVD
ncbi:MAG: hypothetical protein HRT88_08980 [Lentisphaeraceae bacterium]|nr:hypothetical protein [Lentisphaeraceae bacterium]